MCIWLTVFQQEKIFRKMNLNQRSIFCLNIYILLNIKPNLKPSYLSFTPIRKFPLLLSYLPKQFQLMRKQSNTQAHILKFLHNRQTLNLRGKKCYPHQTYGVSEQSPLQFKQKNTLISDKGHKYKYQNLKQFQYPSQSNFFDVRGYSNKTTPSQLQERLSENPLAFHRKKGRLSQFMDKNGWMSSVVPIMGFERSDQTRYLANRDKQKRIISTKSFTNYSNSASKNPKANQQYHNKISALMSQKLKIRKERQNFNQRQLNNPPVTITEPQLRQIDIENVNEKIFRSTKVFFNSTTSTFHNSRMKIQTSQKILLSRRSNFSLNRTNKYQSQQKDASTQKRSKSAFSKEKIPQQKLLPPGKLFMKRIIHEDIMSPQQMNFQEWQVKKIPKNTLFNSKMIDSEVQTNWKQYKINNL